MYKEDRNKFIESAESKFKSLSLVDFDLMSNDKGIETNDGNDNSYLGSKYSSEIKPTIGTNSISDMLSIGTHEIALTLTSIYGSIVIDLCIIDQVSNIVVAEAKYVSPILIEFSSWIVDLLDKYEGSIVSIDSTLSDKSFIDLVMNTLNKKSIDPFKRLYIRSSMSATKFLKPVRW
jgi:hypothetical protein